MSIHDEQRFQQRFDQGDNYIARRMFSQAIIEYKEALIYSGDSKSPDFHLTLYKLALALRDNQELEKAIVALNQLLILTPEDEVVHGVLGGLFAGAGELEKALNSYQEAIRLDPEYVDAYHNMAIALKEAGQYEEASKAYQKALEFAPDEPDIHYSYGNVLRRLDRLGEAIEEYQTAIKLKSDYADAYNNLGLTLNEMRRYSKAALACLHGLDYAPGDLDLQSNLQDALDGQAETD